MELANGLVVMPLAYVVVGRVYALGWFSLTALLAVCAILLVGAAFWYLKSRDVDGAGYLSRPGVRAFFRASKVGSRAALVGVTLLLAARQWLAPGATRGDLVSGAALLALGWLEYINCFHVQLSYDNLADLRFLYRYRRLKRAIMVRELGI